MRDEAHAALDRLLDALERSPGTDEARSARLDLLTILQRVAPEAPDPLARMAAARDRMDTARGLNDPQRRLEERDGAYRAAADAFADLFGDAALERAAMACDERSPLDPLGAGVDDLGIARGGVDPDALRGHEGRKQARNALARLVEDHVRLLPPGFAVQISRSLYELNHGGKTDMFAPYKIRGRDKPLKVTRDLAIYARIYYTAGYYGISRSKAIAKVGEEAPAHISDKLSEDTMDRYANRNSYRPALARSKKEGEDDKRRGRPFRPRVAANYSLEQLWGLKPDE